MFITGVDSKKKSVPPSIIFCPGGAEQIREGGGSVWPLPPTKAFLIRGRNILFRTSSGGYMSHMPLRWTRFCLFITRSNLESAWVD